MTTTTAPTITGSTKAPDAPGGDLSPPAGSATRFTFMSDDGKYPIASNGKVQWASDREETVKQAKSHGYNILVEMDDQGRRVGRVNLKSPNHSFSPVLTDGISEI